MRIVLLGRMGSVAPEVLRAHLACEYELAIVRDVAEAGLHKEAIAQAEVIVGGPITREVAGLARRLRLFHAAQAGLDRLGLDRLAPDVLVANTYNHEVSIAEYAVMSMLMLARLPHVYDRELRQGRWDSSWIWGDSPAISVLAGSNALVIGLGHIAREIIPRAGALAVRITGVSRAPRPQAGVEKVVGYDTWREELPAADFVIPCCPLVEETRGLIGAAEIGRMQTSGCLINAARAEIVDEAALYESLRDHRIAGAALDVWYQYPRVKTETFYPSRFPFHELPNVIMTPHSSGWTKQTAAGRMRDIAENINRLSRGEALQNVVAR